MSNVVLPALLAAPDIVVAEEQPLPDVDQCLRAAHRIWPDVVLFDADLLTSEKPQVSKLGVALLPAKLVLLLDSLDAGRAADEILTNHVNGVLLAGDSGQSVVSALRRVNQGEIWLPRWLLCEALVRFRAGGPGHWQVAAGHQPVAPPILTPRENEMANLVATGLSNKEIAKQAGVSIDTVKKHLRNLFRKLNVHHRTQMLALLVKSEHPPEV